MFLIFKLARFLIFKSKQNKTKKINSYLLDAQAFEINLFVFLMQDGGNYFHTCTVIMRYTIKKQLKRSHCILLHLKKIANFLQRSLIYGKTSLRGLNKFLFLIDIQNGYMTRYESKFQSPISVLLEQDHWSLASSRSSRFQAVSDWHYKLESSVSLFSVLLVSLCPQRPSVSWFQRYLLKPSPFSEPSDFCHILPILFW